MEIGFGKAFLHGLSVPERLQSLYSSTIVQKLWNYCNILRDDGPFYGDYVELVKRDEASLDIFWLKDESLSESENLPAPDVIAQEIMDDLESALEQMREIAAGLEDRTRPLPVRENA